MVFDRPQQLTTARASVASFFAQNWPFKELIVYNATQYRIIPWWKRRPRVREIRLKLRLPGQMLALCAENANGEWLANWLPDCWYHPDYLSTLMQNRSKTRLSLLRNKQVYALKDKKLLVVANDTILCWCYYRHFPVNFEAKAPITEQFTDVAHINAPAHLAIKFAREIV